MCFVYVVKSKTRSKQKRVIQSDQDVQVCGFFVWQRVDELLCMIHLSSLISLDVDYLSLFFSLFFWHVLWACGIPSLGMHLLFHHFFFIVHILDGHFREKESWYVMEFYFMGGWQCLLSSSVEVCEWMCTWSWSWEYDKSLTRVKEFDKTQSKVKLHMKVWAWTSNFGFGRISLIWGDKLLMIFLKKKYPKYFARKSMVPFIQSYHISQLLR